MKTDRLRKKLNKVYFLISKENKEVSENVIYDCKEILNYFVVEGEFIIRKDYDGYSYILLERNNQSIIRVCNDNIFIKQKEAKEKIKEIDRLALYKLLN